MTTLLLLSPCIFLLYLCFRTAVVICEVSLYGNENMKTRDEHVLKYIAYIQFGSSIRFSVYAARKVFKIRNERLNYALCFISYTAISVT